MFLPFRSRGRRPWLPCFLAAPLLVLASCEAPVAGGASGVEEPSAASSEESEVEPDINAFLVLDQEPTPTNFREVRARIAYPSIARDAGIEGMVLVRVLVGTAGEYRRHKVLNSPHPLLARVVEEHVGELRFEAGVRDGKSVPAWINLPFSFRMQ